MGKISIYLMGVDVIGLENRNRTLINKHSVYNNMHQIHIHYKTRSVYKKIGSILISYRLQDAEADDDACLNV